uniref:Reverse transcriptase n=1 Tax=Cacopsylla melanoneura TaxID=428564 RepID=A0A8D8LZW3_9HEMI
MLDSEDFDLTEAWKATWERNCPALYKGLPCINSQPPGFDTRRKVWVTLNRIRTNTGKCAHSLHQWGKADSAACDCGAEEQTIQHIVTECPRRKYTGSLDDFLYATENVIRYIEELDLDI